MQDHKALIRSGLKPASCEQCGYCERRLTDNKIPLLLVFEDNNEKNHKIENIKVFCYNCSFTAGRIWVKIKDRKRWLNDPDRLQGSSRDTIQKFWLLIFILNEWCRSYFK